MPANMSVPRISPFGTPASHMRVIGTKIVPPGEPTYSLVEDMRHRIVFVSPFPGEIKARAFYNRKYDGATAIKSDYSGDLRKSIHQMRGILSHLGIQASNRQATPLGLSLLDIGCGAGHFVAVAQRRGFDAFGLDSEESGINSTISNFPYLREHFFLGTITDVNLPRSSFDNITFLDVLEHMVDPIAALKKSFDLLDDNGRLFIQSIYYDNGWPEQLDWTDPISKIEYHGWPAFVQEHHREHVMVYSIEGLAYVLSEAGFMLDGVFKTPGHDCPIVAAQKIRAGQQIETENKKVEAKYHEVFDIR